MKQLLISVFYLHSIGIIHRDIKPENILITMDNHNQVTEIKIIDFGFAKLFNDCEKLNEMCGTPNYVGNNEYISGFLMRFLNSSWDFEKLWVW